MLNHDIISFYHDCVYHANISSFFCKIIIQDLLTYMYDSYGTLITPHHARAPSTRLVLIIIIIARAILKKAGNKVMSDRGTLVILARVTLKRRIDFTYVILIL